MHEYDLDRGGPSMNPNMYLSALLMAATCCTLMLAYLSYKRRSSPIAISYGLGMLVSSFYTFGYGFEIISQQLDHIRFWLRIEYVGILLGPVFYFLMVLHYTGRESWVRTRNVLLLLLVPSFTFITHNTNEWHHLFYTNMTIDTSWGFPLVSLEKGPLFSVHVVFSYTLFFISVFFLVQMLLRATPPMKKQIIFMIIGSCGPFMFSLIYLSNIFHSPLDFSPFGFVISGIFYTWGVFQFNLLRLAPLAYQKVFESIQDAVIVFDLDHVLTSYNRSARRIIESLHPKGLGQHASQVLVQYPQLLAKLLEQEPLNDVRKIQLSNDPSSRTYNVHLSLVQHQSGKPIGKMLLLNDVTEAVQAEKKLRDNAQQLSELNTFKDRMFNVVAHDIRDPVAVLVNLMDLLEEEIQESNADHEEIIHEMKHQIHNTFALVEGLLEWFRSQGGGQVFHPVERDLHYSVEASIRLLRVRSENKHIQMVSNISPGVCVYADKEMLDLILRNLLSNSIKFTNPGGQITLNAERKDQHIVVSVSDTGEGITDEQARSLLQDEYPVSATGTAGERGIGFGLNLCREFVRLNGGEIWFDSRPSQGSNFYFSVPLAPQSNANESSPYSVQVEDNT
ncbi:histidine kinase N-terminal 7TM domain-containing protein [Paenibacillus xylanexedens]|nr:histidine kinase N-terminal 7TM domain-containing protein [Paenibacillus xylanexedens]